MRTILLLITLLLIPLHAFAEGSPESRAAAKQHYESGEKAFRLGDFDQAVAEWRESYKLSSVPLLLYNIAQAYRQKGDSKQALFFYQQFVATGPTGEARQIAEKRIDELKQAVAAQQKAQTAPPQGPEPPVVAAQAPEAASHAIGGEPAPHVRAARRDWYRSKVAWPVGSVGLVALGVGLGLGVQGLSYSGQADRASTLPMQKDLANKSTAFQVPGWTLVGVGAAALITSVALFIYEARRSK